MSPNKNNRYKDYVEDSKNRSNMKLVYILIGLTALTIILIVLLVMWLGSSPGGNPDKTQSFVKTTGTGVITPGNTGIISAGTGNNATQPANTGTDNQTFELTVANPVNQVPDGAAPAFTVGTGENQGSIMVDNSIKGRGDLILVSAETNYTLDPAYKMVSEANIYNVSRNEIKYPITLGNNGAALSMERRALSALALMFKDAEAAGQTGLSVVKAYNSQDPTGAMDVDWYPDYATGLGVYIGVVSNGYPYAQRPQAKWLLSNSYLYGFVQRFQADKKALTGQDGNSAVYRYVGFPHAYIMKEKNWCLEEYDKYLRENSSIKINNNGKLAYEISYTFMNANSADGKTACKISPEALAAYNAGTAKITVSGDNFAGFIVTVIYTS